MAEEEKEDLKEGKRGQQRGVREEKDGDRGGERGTGEKRGGGSVGEGLDEAERGGCGGPWRSKFAELKRISQQNIP